MIDFESKKDDKEKERVSGRKYQEFSNVFLFSDTEIEGEKIGKFLWKTFFKYIVERVALFKSAAG